jgi:hypothetical protein
VNSNAKIASLSFYLLLRPKYNIICYDNHMSISNRQSPLATVGCISHQILKTTCRSTTHLQLGIPNQPHTSGNVTSRVAEQAAMIQGPCSMSNIGGDLLSCLVTYCKSRGTQYFFVYSGCCAPICSCFGYFRGASLVRKKTLFTEKSPLA